MPSLVEIGSVILEKIFKVRQDIFAISLSSLLRKGRGSLILEREHESPSPKNALCHVWLKLALWFFTKKIFNLCQCIFAISLSSPLENEWGNSFE